MSIPSPSGEQPSRPKPKATRMSSDHMRDLPPVMVPDDIDWEATKAEYVSLLGMSRRTPEQNERYFDLSRLMDRRPPPWMTAAEREKYIGCIEHTEQAMFEAASGFVPPKV